MRWIVLPSISAAEWINAITATEIPAIAAPKIAAITAPKRINSIATTDICIAIEVVVAVNVDIATAPTAPPSPTTTPKEAHRYSHSKRDRSGRVPGSVVRRIVDVRIWINRRTPNVSRIV